MRGEGGQHLLIEEFLARQRAFLRRQRLVLEGLQFRRDVALGILQGLAAAVVVRHLVGLAVRDFDVEAVHLVVFDAQVGDAGARALARFQVDQELPGVFRQAAQLVEVGVEAARDHAAVAHHGGGLQHDGAFQQVEAFGRIGQVVEDGVQQRRFGVARAHADIGAQRRQVLQAGAQAGEVARARRQAAPRAW